MTDSDQETGADNFDGVRYLRLALTRTREDQATVTFRRDTIVQAVRQFSELEKIAEEARQWITDNQDDTGRKA